ncbi:MAG TPA: zinc-binding dehydrogenase [Gemmatimonadales bacterium]|jgi:NADPH:quinone reductase-like Zn-dependent oxidoreductase
MRALVLTGHGDLSQLEVSEVEQPVVQQPDHVRVRVYSAALNHLDLWTLKGLPGVSLRFPHTLGGDGAGVVEEVGSGVESLTVGDRVLLNPGLSCARCEYCAAGKDPLCRSYRLLGEHVNGTAAEQIVVPAANAVPIPFIPEGHPPLSWVEAGSYGLVGLTAWRMLAHRAKVRAGETVLVWGVGGGVSGMALKIAKLMGATVVVTSSSDAKLRVAESWGADHTINHATEDVVARVREITGRRGVDVVVENVGEATWDRSLRALSRGGRLVTCGATTGPTVTIDVRRLFWYQWDILGSTMGGREDFDEAVRLLAEDRLRPAIDSVFSLERSVEAVARLASGDQMGKIAIAIHAEAQSSAM